MTALTALQLALAVLPMIRTGVTEFIAWINTLKAELQRTGEWTPELAAAHRAAIWAATGDPAYRPDPA